ncbi:hypothetical protein BH11BAC1_BH11BAC1_04400 [soil metagenome]
MSDVRPFNKKKISVPFFFTASCCFLLLLASCHPTKKIVDTPHPVKLKGASVIQLFDSLMVHQFDFEWLTAKAEVEFTDKENKTESFDVNIRVKKDSAIWLSVTPLLGIEAVRVLITPDSLKIMNRLRKTYTARGFNFLDDMLKAHINFEIMQAVLVGNYFPYLKNEKLKSVYEDSTYVILSTLNKRQTKRIMEEKDPTKPIIQDFWIDDFYRINRSKISDDKLDRTLQAEYSDFFEVDQKRFPQNLLVIVTSASPLKIKVKYTKVTSGEQQGLPFTVPEKYERK